MTLPWPNFAHGDRGISAKPRGAARFLSDLHMCRVGDGLAGWGGGIRTSAYKIGICQDFSAQGAELELVHLELKMLERTSCKELRRTIDA